VDAVSSALVRRHVVVNAFAGQDSCRGCCDSMIRPQRFSSEAMFALALGRIGAPVWVLNRAALLGAPGRIARV